MEIKGTPPVSMSNRNRQRLIFAVVFAIFLYFYSRGHSNDPAEVRLDHTVRVVSNLPTSSSPGSDNLLLAVNATNKYALYNTQNEIGLVIDIVTPAAQLGKRLPLNLAIVLDNSGSMQGEKLENAKQAIKQVLLILQPQDIVHFITYSDNAKVVFAAEREVNGRHRLHSLVDSVRAEGFTNMWSGLDLALRVISMSASPSHSNSILLFSDGQVNAGEYVSTPSLLAKVRSDVVGEAKCKLSALGVGADFNEELMRGMADEGRGTYYYIQDARALSRFVDSALNAFLSPFAYDAVLEVKVPSSSSTSPRVSVVGHSDPSAILLGDLVAENTRTVIAEVTLLPIFVQEHDPITIATVSLTYRSLTGETFRLSHDVVLEMTMNGYVWESGIDYIAIAKVLLAQTARRDEEIYGHLREGRVEEAQRESMLLVKELEIVSELAKEEMEIALQDEAANYLVDAKERVTKLASGGSTAKLKKEFQQSGYMKAKNSQEYRKVVQKQ